MDTFEGLQPIRKLNQINNTSFIHSILNILILIFKFFVLIH